ncbi:MAG: hypothetical protein R3C42_03840 [Parvularculaceae bacterium]|nr:hypothetical protein [Parvularculaceae bacterium]
MSPKRLAILLALSSLAFAPSLAAADEMSEMDAAQAETHARDGVSSGASDTSDKSADANSDKESAEKPKMVCRYVKTSTSRLGKKVCAPAEE